MDYILDTNIILAYIRNSSLVKFLDKKYAPLEPENTPIISVVSIGEIESLAIRNQWGSKKNELLQTLLNKFVVADINSNAIIKDYAKIDAFSQGKLKNVKSNFTARNMGKNDIWIAATASVLKIKLLTTDKDFNHLKDVFIDLEIIAI